MILVEELWVKRFVRAKFWCVCGSNFLEQSDNGSTGSRMIVNRAK